MSEDYGSILAKLLQGMIEQDADNRAGVLSAQMGVLHLMLELRRTGILSAEAEQRVIDVMHEADPRVRVPEQ